MPDLHGWITQQIERAEAAARAADKEHGRQWAVTWDACRDGFEIRDDSYTLVADRVQPGAASVIALHDPDAVLRRCAADRRVLARHRLDPDVHYEPACKGCGTYGDMELPETDNLNECPELLDLAHAHGITDEILASLDQPVPPPMPPRPEPRVTNLSAIVRLLSAQPTSSVPPPLRGPNWKAPHA